MNSPREVKKKNGSDTKPILLKSKIHAFLFSLTILMMIGTSCFHPAVAQSPFLLKGVAIGFPGPDASSVCKILPPAKIALVRTDVVFSNNFRKVYDSCKQRGLSIVGIIDYGTLQWKNFTLDDWRNVVTKAQATYPEIHVWEIWNEATLKKFQYSYLDGTPQRYFDLLVSAYSVLKAVDTKAIILGFGGLQLYSSQDFLFAQGVFSLGGGSYMDAISIHAYPYLLNNGSSWDYYQALWSQQLSRYKDFGKPIWITETGLRSSQLTESDQSRYLQASYNFFLGQNAAAYFWYSYKDYKNYSSEDIVKFGLIRLDGTPKPSFDSYIAAQELIVMRRI